VGEAKQSASYSFSPTKNDSASTVDRSSARAGGGGGGGLAPNRKSINYKSMALHAYANKRASSKTSKESSSSSSDSSGKASSQTDSDDRNTARTMGRGGNKSPLRLAAAPASASRSGSSDGSSAKSSAGSEESVRIARREPARRRNSTHSQSSSRALNHTGALALDDKSGGGRRAKLRKAQNKARALGHGRGRVAPASDSSSGEASPLRPSRKRQLQSVAKASLYVQAKQPPWVAAVGEASASESDDSSEDERDNLREGKLKDKDGHVVVTGCCRIVSGCLNRVPSYFVSVPDPVQRELPPDREWERAERALAITGSNIRKRCFNVYGRCSPKKCTAPRQLRMFMFGCFADRTSKTSYQLLPQLVGAMLIGIEAFVLLVMEDKASLVFPISEVCRPPTPHCSSCAVNPQAPATLQAGPGPMLAIASATLLKLYLLAFGCQHHREWCPGQLLVHFEGASWQVCAR
jgi:hypothetical protein